MISEPFQGTGTALVTPFRDDGSVDYEALVRLVDMQIEGGVDMLVPCGTTGEAVSLTDEEYEKVVGTVVERVARRIRVIAGAGSNSTARTIRASAMARDCGVDAILVVGPYYNKPNRDGLFAHFRSVTEAVQLPTLLYNVPGRTGSNIDAATQLRIAELEYIVGTKEASGNISQIMSIISGKPDSFTVLSGDDNLTLALLAVGADGGISVIANEAPMEFSSMVHAALDGDWSRARDLHYRLLPLMEANFVDSNPIPVKAALARMGLIREVYRLPLAPMGAREKERLYSAMKQSGISE